MGSDELPQPVDAACCELVTCDWLWKGSRKVMIRTVESFIS